MLSPPPSLGIHDEPDQIDLERSGGVKLVTGLFGYTDIAYSDKVPKMSFELLKFVKFLDFLLALCLSLGG